MAYNLKSIGDRVTALEAKKYSTWTKGSNTNGYWVKESTTGLIIQWGRNGSNGTYETGGTRTFPIAFTNASSITMAAVQWSTTNGNTGSWSERIRALSTTSFYWWANVAQMHWIAIGYLISDRILNYIYIAIFVHIFLIFFSFFYRVKQGGVNRIMAISLNSINSTLSSHGTRITNLENKATNGYVTMVSLWTGTARNTTITVAALANYNVCWFKTSWGDCMCYKGGSTVIYDDADNGNIDRISISWSGTTVTTSTGNAWHNIALTQICGLKI